MEEAINLMIHLPLPGGKRGLICRTGRAPGIKHKTVFGNYKDSKGYNNTNTIKKQKKSLETKVEHIFREYFYESGSSLPILLQSFFLFRIACLKIKVKLQRHIVVS